MTTAEQRNAALEASRPLAEALGQRRELRPGDTVRIPSRTVSGVSYEVVLAHDGQLLCNCPASYNHLDCWHAKYVREEMMSTETALAIRPISLTTTALVPSREDIDRVNEAAAMVMSGAVTLPAELKNKQQVAALMLYGLELGLRPMTALRHLYIVNGKVQPSSEVMAGMLMRSDPRAKLIVENLKVTGTGDSLAGSCTMRILRPSRAIDQTYTVDWADIKRAGLARENNLKYPEDRLRYHCTKRLLRIYAPDIINAFDDGPSFSTMVVEGSPEIDAAALYNEGDDEAVEGEWVDRETGEIHEPATALATDAQQKRIKAMWNGEHFNAPLIFERYGNGNGGIKSLKLLTVVEADDVIALLEAKAPAPDCEHVATQDEERALLVCSKCGIALEGPDAVQAPALGL